MNQRAFDVARRYITYRYNRALIRKSNTTDEQILSLIECNNEEVKQENANKNPTVNSVQRDYMAGEVSKDITRRILLPREIVEAHEQGIIHFHDMDYFAQHMHNCDLVNLEDMLQNGTVITGTLIEKPHSFSTACNIATQIVAQVASNQYGGQSISLAHLAPFVQISREKIRREVEVEIGELGVSPDEAQISKIVERRLREEIKRGVQIMVKESRRLTNMVEELLQFSRLEDGRFTLQVEDTDLQAELEDAVYSYRELFRQDGIALEYSSDRAEYSEVISGDPERLKQVFCNLLDNAAKHGGSGKRIAVHLSQQEGEYVITIRDFGPGIPEAELPYVKQKFYKGSSKARGSGIGLAVCDEIVQRHGGRLDIANAEGGGTVVTVYLPLKKQAEQEL